MFLENHVSNLTGMTLKDNANWREATTTFSSKVVYLLQLFFLFHPIVCIIIMWYVLSK